MKACEMNAAFGLAQLKKLEHFKVAGKGRLGRHLRIGRDKLQENHQETR